MPFSFHVIHLYEFSIRMVVHVWEFLIWMVTTCKFWSLKTEDHGTILATRLIRIHTYLTGILGTSLHEWSGERLGVGGEGLGSKSIQIRRGGSLHPLCILFYSFCLQKKLLVKVFSSCFMAHGDYFFLIFFPFWSSFRHAQPYATVQKCIIHSQAYIFYDLTSYHYNSNDTFK